MSRGVENAFANPAAHSLNDTLAVVFAGVGVFDCGQADNEADGGGQNGGTSGDIRAGVVVVMVARHDAVRERRR